MDSKNKDSGMVVNHRPMTIAHHLSLAVCCAVLVLGVDSAEANKRESGGEAPEVPTIAESIGAATATELTLTANSIRGGGVNGVEYRFNNLTLSKSSDWLTTPTWTDTGLNPGTAYTYTVQSRDTSSDKNESGQSSAVVFHTLKKNPSGIRIVNTFSFARDLASDPAYSTNHGLKDNLDDRYGVDKPVTLPLGKMTSFSAVGCDKLVGVLTLHNSSKAASAVTSLTYGGVDVFTTSVANEGIAPRQYIFYMDSPTVRGDLVIGLDEKNNVDELGLVLFALKGAAPGILGSGTTKTSTSASVSVSAGDFILGAAGRNNQILTVDAPFVGVDLSADSMNMEVAYLVAPSIGKYQPVYAGSSPVSTLIASFAARRDKTPSGYEHWALANAPKTGDDMYADEDKDGVANGFEFVLGGSSKTNDKDKLPVVIPDDGDLVFTFERSRASISPSIQLSIEESSDLVSWEEAHRVPDDRSVKPPLTVEPGSSPGMDAVNLRVPNAEDGNLRYVRLKVIVEK